MTGSIHETAPTDEEIREARRWAAQGRIPTNSWLMEEGIIGYLQRKGLLSVEIIDYPRGKPLFVHVRAKGAAA